jgi:hypothetical protein
LTKWLDPALDSLARQSGIPVDQFSSQVGGEGIGVGLEVISDMFTKGWLNKAIQGIAGLMATSYAIWGRGVPDRLRRELLALGTHELLRVSDPKPSDILELRSSIEEFSRAVANKDLNAALASVLRTPAEIQSMLGIQGPAAPAVTPAAAPKVEKKQAPAPSKGTYQAAKPQKTPSTGVKKYQVG